MTAFRNYPSRASVLPNPIRWRWPLRIWVNKIVLGEVDAVGPGDILEIYCCGENVPIKGLVNEHAKDLHWSLHYFKGKERQWNSCTFYYAPVWVQLSLSSFRKENSGYRGIECFTSKHQICANSKVQRVVRWCEHTDNSACYIASNVCIHY